MPVRTVAYVNGPPTLLEAQVVVRSAVVVVFADVDGVVGFGRDGHLLRVRDDRRALETHLLVDRVPVRTDRLRALVRVGDGRYPGGSSALSPFLLLLRARTTHISSIFGIS